MTQAELDALVSCIADHANGENKNQKDHIQEFNDPQRKAPLGIRSREEFEQHIKETLLNQETVGFSQHNGQEFYYNRDTNTVVLLDGKGSGTAFRPDKRGDYLQRKHFLQERQIGVELSLKEGGILAHHPELAHEKVIHKTAEPENLTWYEVQQKRAALHKQAENQQEQQRAPQPDMAKERYGDFDKPRPEVEKVNTTSAHAERVQRRYEAMMRSQRENNRDFDYTRDRSNERDS